jgi:stage II sporulation protein D
MRVSLKNIFLSAFFFYMNMVCVHAERLHIGLFNSRQIQSFTFSVFKGSYQLFADSNYLYDIDKNNVLYCVLTKDQIALYDVNGLLGKFKTISCYGIEEKNRFKVSPVKPEIAYRVYDDDLTVFPSFGSMVLVNEVFMDHYLAGVVETESGVNRHLEFYKAQVCLARTYALKNKDRHAGENFHLCDEVHCQAYKGRSNDPNILQATEETKGIVVTHDSALITAFFHANCGGETQNADQVWFISEPYLKSVKDPFCLKSRGVKWEKTIPLEEWKNYLQKQMNTNTLSHEQIMFDQPKRVSHYGNTGIPLTKIREDWNLRSTFFSVEVNGDKILLKGRGYGHGVGLCQEGAMEMARRGFDYVGILNYYFNDIRLVPFIQIPVK